MRPFPGILLLLASLPACSGPPSPKAEPEAVAWAFESRLETAHLRIYSSRPVEFTRRLADVLEDEIAAYTRLHRGVWELKTDPAPFRVYLIADREVFEEVLQADAGFEIPDELSGMYCMKTRILYVGISLDRAEEDRDDPDFALAIAAHEMVHAMDELLAARLDEALPAWILEGRADYFGYAIRDRKIVLGSACIPPEDLTAESLEASIASVSLESLVDLRKADLTGEHYPLCWAWVHFLHHGEGGRHAAGYLRFLSGVAPGKASRADLEKALGSVRDLAPAFREYVTRELLPVIRRKG